MLLFFSFVFGFRQHIGGSALAASLMGCSSNIPLTRKFSGNLTDVVEAIIDIEEENCIFADITRNSLLSNVIPDISKDTLALHHHKERIKLLQCSKFAVRYLQKKMQQFNNNGNDEVVVVGKNSSEKVFYSLFARTLPTFSEGVLEIIKVAELDYFFKINRLIQRHFSIRVPAMSLTLYLLNESLNLRNHLVNLTEKNSNENGFYESPKTFVVPIEHDLFINRINFFPSKFSLVSWLISRKNSNLLATDTNAQKSVSLFIRRLQGNSTDRFFYLNICGDDVTNGFEKAGCLWTSSRVELHEIVFSDYIDSNYDGSKTLANLHICCERETIITVLEKFSKGTPSLKSAMTKETNENAAIFIWRLMRIFQIFFCDGNCIDELRRFISADFYEEGGKFCWMSDAMKLQCGGKSVYEKFIKNPE